MPIINLEQNTDDWLRYRRSKIMATDASKILGLCPFSTMSDLYDEKIGLTNPKPANAAMIKGKELESVALQMFCDQIGYGFKPCVYQSDEKPWMAASLDGMTCFGNSGDIVEIKCSKYCYEMLEQKFVPENYRCQMSHQMECTGLDMCYYFVYWNGKGLLHEYFRDQEFIDHMVAAELEFYNAMVNLDIPSGYNEDRFLKNE